MNDLVLDHSFKLGSFTGMVQAMEDAVVGARPKGEQWGEHLLPLYMANIESTIQIASKIMSNLPKTAMINGVEVSVEEALTILKEIDIQLLEHNIHDDSFRQGYHRWQDRDAGPVEVKDVSNPCYNLGVFIANLQCMEEAMLLSDPTSSPTAKIEHILLLLEMNLDSTMQIVDKILASLPETVIFKGKDISIEQLLKSRKLLSQMNLRELEFRKDIFMDGYHNQLRYYLS